MRGVLVYSGWSSRRRPFPWFVLRSVSVMTAFGPTLLVAISLVLAGGAGEVTAHAAVAAPIAVLTEGVWHGRQGQGEVAYEFTLRNGGLTVTIHMLREGKKTWEFPPQRVQLEEDRIVIGSGSPPTFRGRVDADAGRIDAELDFGPNASPMRVELTRVALTDLPMLRARPATEEGEPAYQWLKPELLEDGWETASPETVGIDSASVDATLRAIIHGDAGVLHSFLVARHGKLVIEEYFHGYGRDDLHELQSATKSVSSLLIGIAIDQGRIDGVTTPVRGFFPERSQAAGRGWDDLQLRHLLTMTAGLDWRSAEVDGFSAPGTDRFRDVLTRSVVTPPGSRFRYVSREINLLAGVLRSSTGQHADVFAAQHLFAPLGVSEWNWDRNKYDGYPSMAGTLDLRPRDMAKIGQLILDGGVWRGRRIVSEDWIRESTRSHVDAGRGFEGYGFLWWLLQRPEEIDGPVLQARGLGSQFIVVVPSENVVLTTTGGNHANGKMDAIMGLLAQLLLPGIGPASP
jgi:CubicO group peptidase (beta-lactamase class C family)